MKLFPSEACPNPNQLPLPVWPLNRSATGPLPRRRMKLFPVRKAHSAASGWFSCPRF